MDTWSHGTKRTQFTLEPPQRRKPEPMPTTPVILNRANWSRVIMNSIHRTIQIVLIPALAAFLVAPCSTKKEPAKMTTEQNPDAAQHLPQFLESGKIPKSQLCSRLLLGRPGRLCERPRRQGNNSRIYRRTHARTNLPTGLFRQNRPCRGRPDNIRPKPPPLRETPRPLLEHTRANYPQSPGTRCRLAISLRHLLPYP